MYRLRLKPGVRFVRFQSTHLIRFSPDPVRRLKEDYAKLGEMRKSRRLMVRPANAWLAPIAIGACASRNGLQTIDPQNGRAVIAEPVSARA
jgi:hypothetical protein